MKTALNLPNQITIARLGLAVVFFILLSQYSQVTPKPLMLDVAAVIFIIAAVTDILDGYLARKWGQVTALGRVLDPLVDKVRKKDRPANPASLQAACSRADATLPADDGERERQPATQPESSPGCEHNRQ